MRRNSCLGFVVTLVAANVIVFVGDSHVAQATTITVNTALDIAPDTNGNFPNDGLCSLRAAIRAAEFNSNATDVNCATGVDSALDRIVLAPSLAGQTFRLTYAISGQVQPFDIIYGELGGRGPIEIAGSTTNPADFVISGENVVRPFSIGFGTVAAGALKLTNLTVANGDGTGNGSSNSFAPDGFGGAIAMGALLDFEPPIVNVRPELTLDNVVLRDNRATSNGGAIYASMPIITNNGGAYLRNTAARGGAVASTDGDFTLNGYAVLFEANTASQFGGAIYSNPGSTTALSLAHLERSLLKDNSATSAGGVMYVDSSVAGRVFELHDSTATGNSSVLFTVSNQQSFEFLRDTFVDSGQIFRAGAGFMANTIVSGGSCANTAATSNFGGSRNLISGATGCGLAELADIGDVTGLGALAQNGGPAVQRTFALAPTSNAVDNGAAAYCGTVDARSVARGIEGNGTANNPQTGDCDIGSYEYAKYVVNFVTGTTVVNEAAGTAAIQVRLKMLDPDVTSLAAPLTVSIVQGAGSTARVNTGLFDDVTIPGGGVIFQTGATDGTIANLTITIVQDDRAELAGETAVLQLGGSATPGVAIAEPKTSNVAIQDDDQAGVTITQSGGSTTVSENSTGTGDTVQVKLRSQPDFIPNTFTPADVTMTVRPDRDCTVSDGVSTGTSASPLVSTILNANWNVNKTLTVFAVDDQYDEDLRNESAAHSCELRFTFTSPDPVYANTQDAFNASVIDNDTAGVTMGPLGSTTIDEGTGSVTWQVALTSAPDPGKPLPGTPRAATTVRFTPSSQCNVGAGPGLARDLTFTEANWGFLQTVTITATQDPVVELSHPCTVTTTVLGGDPIYNDLSAAPPFAGTPGEISAMIQDYFPPTITDDPPFADVTASPLLLDESVATGASVSVVLRRAPLSGSVVVQVDAVVDSAIGGRQLDVRTGVAAFTGNAVLTFTSANWNIAQTLEVRANDDDFDEAAVHSGALSTSITSTAPGFSDPTLRRVVVNGTEFSGPAPLTAAISDDDTSAIVVAETGGTTLVSEAGTADTINVSLATHPYQAVNIVATSGPDCLVEGVSSFSFTVAAADWNVLVPLAVTAVDDSLLEDDPHDCVIDVAATSGDALYSGLTDQVTASVDDNESAVVEVTTTGAVEVSEGGTTEQFSVVLGAQPDADVTVGFLSAFGQATTGSSTFTPANWDTPKLVTVTAVDDNIDELSPHADSLTLDLTTNAQGYRSAPVLKVNSVQSTSIPVSITDNDTAAMTVSKSALSLSEAGAADTFTVVLGSEPTDPVTVTVAASGLCTAGPASFTFDDANWSTPVTITVTPGSDDLDHTQSCTVDVTTVSTDPLYNARSASATGAVTDNDTAGVTVATGDGISVAEWDAATGDTYTVVLTSEPTDPVTITVSPNAQVTASPLTLTFTAADWDQPQTVTVKAVDDALVETSPHAGSVAHTVASTDTNYSGFSTASAAVSIGDDDTDTVITITPTISHDAAATSAIATVTGGATQPTGTVQFGVDAASVGSPVVLVAGVATLDLGTLSNGSHTVTADYSGDATHAASSDTITVSVTAKPVADDETLTVAEDAPATAIDVLTGDTDGDGDTLTVAGHSTPAHGTVVCTTTGCTYQPALNYNGPDSFTYTVDDGTGLTDTANVTVTVTPVDDPPVAPIVGTVSVTGGLPATFELLNGATDADGTLLFIASYGQPSHGSVTCNPAGRCTYTPDPTYTGPDQFSYVVSDGTTPSAPQSSPQRFVESSVVAILQLNVQAAPPTTVAPTTVAPTTVAPRPTTTVRLGGVLPSTGSSSNSSARTAMWILIVGAVIWLLARRPARRDSGSS